MITALLILLVWNAQSIMAVNHQFSCPVSFFTYIIIIVATFIVCMTTVLLVSDRYLVSTCPFLYAEKVAKSPAYYGKYLAYIFIIALMLAGIGFAISPHVLYFAITVLFVGCGLWSLFVFPAIAYEEFFLTPTYTSYQLKVGLHERRKQARLTKYTACHSFVTCMCITPHLVLIYLWFQHHQNITALSFHNALLWSWVGIGVKLIASAFFFSRALNDVDGAAEGSGKEIKHLTKKFNSENKDGAKVDIPLQDLEK